MSCYPKAHECSRQRGFGLLEALVAVVLVSGVGLALMAWVQQNLDTTFRLRQLYAEQSARLDALEWMRALNPMTQPQGETTHGQYRISWKAVQDSPAIVQIGYPQGIGRHEVAIFNVEVKTFRVDQKLPMTVDHLVLIGHRSTGEARAPRP